MSLLKRVKSFFAPDSMEIDLVQAIFRVEPFRRAEPVAKLVNYINSPGFKILRGHGCYHKTSGGCFKLCDDVYGLELYMQIPGNGWGPLMDCCPSNYGLLPEEGRAIFNAVAGRLYGPIS
jgi:hypothetical protein